MPDFEVTGRFRQVNKTASYTINAAKDRSGTVFTTFGAGGAVTFTLPAPSKALKGAFYTFINGADQDMVVATVTADTLLTLHDAAADSIAVSTSSTKLGASIHARCLQNATGYQWQAEVNTNIPGGTTAVNSTVVTS